MKKDRLRAEPVAVEHDLLQCSRPNIRRLIAQHQQRIKDNIPFDNVAADEMVRILTRPLVKLVIANVYAVSDLLNVFLIAQFADGSTARID